jgi:hypothetical protein
MINAFYISILIANFEKKIKDKKKESRYLFGT